MAEGNDNTELYSGASSDDNIVIKIYDEEKFSKRNQKEEERLEVCLNQEEAGQMQENVKEVSPSSPTKRRRKSSLPVRAKDDFLRQDPSTPRTAGAECKSQEKCQAELADVVSREEPSDEVTAGRKRRSARNRVRDIETDQWKTVKGDSRKIQKRQTAQKSKTSESFDKTSKEMFGEEETSELSSSFEDGNRDSGADVEENNDTLLLKAKGKDDNPKISRPHKSKKLTCKKCRGKFPSESSMASHEAICPKKPARVKKFDCEWCHQSFGTVRQRNTHNREEHTEKKAYPCRFCSRIFTESSHCKRHLRSHTGERPFACEICGKEFVDNSYIRRHMLIHKGVKPFQCDQCGKTFREKTHLSRHEETHKREQETCVRCSKALYGDQNRCACKEKVKPVKIEEKKKFSCDKCGKGFTKEGNFQRHLREHEKGSTSQDSVFTCDVCSKVFGLQRHLSRHKRIHTGEKPFQCKECGKQFRDSSYIRRHMRIHAGHKPFQCDLCDKTFRESGHLSRHMLTHTGEKKFNCSTCGKGYQDRVCLLRHESKCVVSSIKPDEKVSQLCDICGKEYLGKGSLRRHRQIHTGKKSHHCSRCPAKFYDNSSLKRHLAIHSRDPANLNQCSICKKVFRTQRGLARHYESHEESAASVRPDKFECSICDIEFPSSASLSFHASSHTRQVIPGGVVDELETEPEPEPQMVLEVNDLECKLCNKLFATPQNLSNHHEVAHSQSILGDTLTPAAITIASASHEISTEVLLPSGLLESSAAANSDDFEGLFKLLQVIAQANQNPPVTVPHSAGNVIGMPAITMSGVDMSSGDNREPTIVTVVPADTNNPSITSFISPSVAVATNTLQSTQPLEEETSGMNGIDDMEFNVSVTDLTANNDVSSDSDEESPKLNCDYCAFDCRRNKSLAIHMANVHPMIVFARQGPVVAEEEEGSKVLQWQCPFCNDVFEAEKDMRVHTCSGVKDKPFKCPRCDLSFPRKPALTQHLKIHENEPKYKCTFCQKTFHFKNSLTYHERIHTQEKPFKCSTCEKAFKDKSHLRRHEKIHQGLKPYSCQICPKTFLERSQLVKHIRVHSGEKPYLCAKCGKSFADASHLRRHNALHETVRERKHQCPDCSKAFRTNDGLRSHRKIHVKEKSFECDICDKAFSDKTTLRRHKRYHKEEKPYSCQICRKAFRERCQLVKHFRVHTGDKPYPCKVCHKRFSDTPQRKRHVMTVHATGYGGEKLSELSFCEVCGEAFTEMDLLKLHLQNHRTRANVTPDVVTSEGQCYP